MTIRQRSCGVSASVAAMLRAEAARLRWRSGTIFGRDVVPEVCSTRATSSGSAAARGIRERNRKRIAAGRTAFVRRQLDQRDLALRGHGARRQVGTALDDQRLGIEVAEIEIELVGAVAGVGGAAVAQLATATNAAAISGPFGITIATA